MAAHMAPVLLAATFAVSLGDLPLGFTVTDCGRGDADVLQSPQIDVKTSKAGTVASPTEKVEISAAFNIQRDIVDVVLTVTANINGQENATAKRMTLSNTILGAGPHSYNVEFEIPSRILSLAAGILGEMDAKFMIVAEEGNTGFSVFCVDVEASLGKSSAEENEEESDPMGPMGHCPTEMELTRVDDTTLSASAELKSTSFALQAGIGILALTVTGTASGSPHLLPVGEMKFGISDTGLRSTEQEFDSLLNFQLLLTNTDDQQLYLCLSSEDMPQGLAEIHV